MGPKRFVGLLACGATTALMLSAPASAQMDRISGTEKGSLLIWSKVEIRWSDAGTLLQDTFLQLTNDYPAAVSVQYYFINGDPPLCATANERAHPGWNWVDNKITLTADQPVYWSALTGLGASGIFDPTFSPFTVLDPGFPPGRPDPEQPGQRMFRGFIIVWAVNNVTGQQIRWNHLCGNGTLVNYAQATAWEYNAWATAVNPNAAAHGATFGTAGMLNLNGTHYAPSFAELLFNFWAVGSTAMSGPRLVTTNTDVTLHVVSADLRQETEGPVTTKAHYLVWNQNEGKLSGAYRCITCWDQTLLSNYGTPNHFNLLALQTNCGKARVDGLASQLCDFDLYGPGGPCLPPPAGLPDGILDIVSQPASLLGLVATHLNFDAGAAFAAAGTNMFGLGTENAVILYDPEGAPPEQNAPIDEVVNNLTRRQLKQLRNSK